MVKRCAPMGRLITKKWIFLPFWRPQSHPSPVHRLAWNFAWPSGPMCPSVVQNFTWICATSHPCGEKMLIFGLWVKTIPAVCRFAAILPVKSLAIINSYWKTIHDTFLHIRMASRYVQICADNALSKILKFHDFFLGFENFSSRELIRFY